MGIQSTGFLNGSNPHGNKCMPTPYNIHPNEGKTPFLTRVDPLALLKGKAEGGGCIHTHLIEAPFPWVTGLHHTHQKQMSAIITPITPTTTAPPVATTTTTKTRKEEEYCCNTNMYVGRVEHKQRHKKCTDESLSG